MNWIIGIMVIVVVVAIVTAGQDTNASPTATQQTALPVRSYQDVYGPIRAGGMVNQAGASFNPTGVSVFLTYDKTGVA